MRRNQFFYYGVYIIDFSCDTILKESIRFRAAKKEQLMQKINCSECEAWGSRSMRCRESVPWGVSWGSRRVRCALMSIWMYTAAHRSGWRMDEACVAYSFAYGMAVSRFEDVIWHEFTGQDCIS